MLSNNTGGLLPRPHIVREAAGGSLYSGSRPDRDELARYTLGLPLPAPIRDGGEIDPEYRHHGREAFSIELAEDSITIRATTPIGRLYAIGALRQLFDHGGPIGCGTIVDWPDLKDRGFMLDVSRNRIPTPEMLDELVDYLLLLRFNHLELYFEHVFAYAGHPDVWTESGGITAAEIRRLDRACSDRGIELVPNQNSFGHLTGWLRHPRYRNLAESPDGFLDPWGVRRAQPFSLAAVEPEVPLFLGALYDELLPLFHSERFNVGLDETFDLGQGRSADRVARIASEIEREERGIDRRAAEKRATGRVYLEMLSTVHRLVEERGYHMVFWGDIIQNHPELVAELPRGVTAVEWGYEPDHDFTTRCDRLRRAGVPFLVAPGTCSWNSPSGRYDTAEVNISASIDAAHRYGAEGVLLTDWGDNGHTQPFVVSLPAIAHAGALAWNKDDETREPFAWVARRRLDDTDGAWGAVLKTITTIDRALPPYPIHNASLLGAALLLAEHPVYAPVIEHASPEFVEALADRLDSVPPPRETAAAATESAQRDRREILYAIELARYAIEVLRRRLGIPVTESTLATTCARAVELLDETWLASYRPEGLDDARSRLTAGANGVEGAPR